MIAAILIAALLLPVGSADTDIRYAESQSQISFAPQTHIGGVALGGLATWYATGPGGFTAAAGPDLRHGKWRGSYVRVSHGGRSVVVRLIDACWCPDRGGRPVLLDLSLLAFERLADATEGVIRVQVETGVGAPAAPRSDTAP